MGHRAFATSDTYVPTAPRDVATGVAVALPLRALVAAPAAELEAADDTTAPALAAALARSRPPRSGRRESLPSLRRRGRHVGACLPTGANDVAVDATLRAAAARGCAARRADGAPAGARVLRVVRGDLREKLRRERVGRLLVLVVDLSGSIGPELFRLARRAAGCLLAEAYLERDEVGLVAFRDVTATVVFAPTSSVELARARLGALPTGGKTPLAAGLAAGWQMLRNARRRSRRARPVLVVISDGQGNVASRPGHAAVLAETARAAAALRALPGLRTVLFDATEDGKNDAAAVRLAQALGAPTLKVHALAELDDARLREVLRHV